MVYNYPFFNFPRPRRHNYFYDKPYINNSFANSANSYNFNANGSYDYNKVVKPDFKYYNKVAKLDFKDSKKLEGSKTSSKDEEVYGDTFFEIFGLKLYFDDVLIICLIWFLYQEGVKDEFLFMALILLLLS